MSANFKFKSFNDEEEGEEEKNEKNTENPPNQKKKIIPWDTSRKEEETISKAAIHPDNSVTTRTFISSVSQFSRLQLAAVCVGIVFVIIVIAVMAANGAKARRNAAALEVRIKHTRLFEKVALKKMQTEKELRLDGENNIKEFVGSSVELSHNSMMEALNNFSAPHVENFRLAEENLRGFINTVNDHIQDVDDSGRETLRQLKSEMDERMNREERETNQQLRDRDARMQRLVNVKYSMLMNHFSVIWEKHKADFEDSNHQLNQDRAALKDTISGILKDIEAGRTNFDETVRQLRRHLCSDPNSNTCSPDAHCVDTINSYTCTCKHGFHGDGFTCQDVNECDGAFHDECHPNADCTNLRGSYTCACKNGFLGDGRKKCEDVDECQKDVCHTDANCRNTAGSFVCECIAGYSGDGIHSCGDVDECETDNPINNHRCNQHAICTNNVGSYLCNCKGGFLGDGFNCSDIDECHTRDYNCSTHATCSNTLGSYNCNCRAGYEGDGKTCQDIDECKNPKLIKCSTDSSCKNTLGSYGCTCLPGFTGNGLECIDVNECADVALNNCSADAKCTNVKGSFECACLDTHQGDGFQCTVNFMKASGNYSLHAPNIRKNWYAAQGFCQDRGGYLAIIGDEAEDNLIRSQIGYVSNNKYWVGAKCVKTRTGVSRNYWVRTNMDFATNYPRNPTTNLNGCDTSEDGIIIKGSVNNVNSWDDIGVYTTPRRIAFICEY